MRDNLTTAINRNGVYSFDKNCIAETNKIVTF